MPAHVHAHAAAGGGGWPGPGLGLGSGSLPGPVLFEPGLTSMGHVDHTRSASGSEPPSATAVCKPSRQLGGWTVAVVEMNRCNGSD